MSKERALDVFALIEQIDAKKQDIWSTLTDEQKKEFSPLITMRWMAGTNSPFQTVMLNELVNTTVFSLPDHKELMLKLLTVCSDGQRKRCSWVNYKVARGSKKQKRAAEIVAAETGLNLNDAIDALPLYTPEELMEMAERQGLQKDELKDLKKELA